MTKGNRIFWGVIAILIASAWFGGFYVLGEAIKHEDRKLLEDDKLSKHERAWTEPGNNNQLMDMDELADYLRVTREDIESILNEDRKLKSQISSSWDTYMFLPYFEITPNHYLFQKKEVDEWISYQTQNRFQN